MPWTVGAFPLHVRTELRTHDTHDSHTKVGRSSVHNGRRNVHGNGGMLQPTCRRGVPASARAQGPSPEPVSHVKVTAADDCDNAASAAL